ncbi:cache domain-containing protein [Arcobacter sp.]|uniref:cache domain-containing protein n=1 Tax=unclassified Arcobacter TaxID=2593671 RepID=UPI003AFFCCDA
MFYKNEKKLIDTIKYAPIILIIILFLITTYFVEKSNTKQFNDETKRITKFYRDYNNNEIKQIVHKVNEYIKTEDKNALDNLKKSLKLQVYDAYTIATKIYSDNKNRRTKKEILELIKITLKSIGKGQYFIIKGEHFLLQASNEKIKDTQSLKMILNSINDNKEGIITYSNYKNSKETPSEKISFYKKFEPLNIYIGKGEYLDTFENNLKKEIIKSIQNHNLNIKKYIFIINSNGIILASNDEKRVGKQVNLDLALKLKDMFNKDEGLFNYEKYNEGESFKKTSFIKISKKWNWILGSGYGDDELNNLIEDANKQLQIMNKNNYYNILYFGIFITTLLLIISIFISKYIEDILLNYKLKIKDEEKEFRNLFENSNIGLAISSSTGKLLNVNSKFSEILGYNSSEEIDNRFWHELSNIKQDDKELYFYNKLLEEKISNYSLEKVFTNKADERKIDILINANLFKENNKIKYILFSITDITEIKEKDNLLFQQSKMASMGEMIANIAHQWRQPLSMISTLSSGLKLQKELDNLSDSYFNDSLESITKSTQYLSQTIDYFKDFFKPSENKSKFYIKEVVDKTLVLLSAELKNKDIEILQDIEDVELTSYENDIIQLFINIINNAKDAFESSSVKNKIISLSTTFNKEENILIICIKDSAGGINSNIIDKIFEPYFTTKHRNMGTGIGLYMVSQIINKHLKGFIEVKNVNFTHQNLELIGAEFIITIPTNIK